MKTELEEKTFSTIKLILSGILLFLSLILRLSDAVILFIRLSAAIISGYEIALKSFKNLLRREFFDENTLMFIAFLAAFLIGESVEGVIILILYGLGELLEDLATDRSREKIAGLAELKSYKANLLIGDKIEEVEPSSVKLGNLIAVRKGDRVPIDGIIAEGCAEFDLKAITGESKLFSLSQGEKIYSGAINLGEAVIVKTEKLYKDSTVEKIIEMVENSTERKSKSQKFITAFAKVYTPCVVMIAVLLAVVPPLFDGYVFMKWIYKSLAFLIVSCPCALVISIPLCFFTGIGALAKRGVLVKGSNYIDVLAATSTAVFDKTGTLTNGDFAVSKIILHNGYSENEILKIAASIEQNSSHPIANALKTAFNGEFYRVSNLKEISGKGIFGEINGVNYSVGKSEMVNEKADIVNFDSENNVVYVVEDGVLIGEIELLDTLKPESRRLVEELRAAGVSKTVILSGDRKAVAGKIAENIGADCVYSELLPAEKTEKLTEIIAENGKGKVLYCGDGINDAPSVAKADVGVAMGTLGSEATIDCADVIIADDNLLKIPYAIKKSKLIKRKVIANIAVSIGVKLAIMALSVFTSLPISIAMIGDVGVMLLAVLNSLTISLYK